MEARIAKAEQAVGACAPTDESIARLEAAVAHLERSTGISDLVETGTRTRLGLPRFASSP